MSRPEDIPEDVWHKAFYWMDDGGFIAAFYTDEDEAALQRTIARAIMAATAAEREACALTALKHAGVDRSDNTRFVAHNIAAAIRARSKPMITPITTTTEG